MIKSVLGLGNGLTYVIKSILVLMNGPSFVIKSVFVLRTYLCNKICICAEEWTYLCD